MTSIMTATQNPKSYPVDYGYHGAAEILDKIYCALHHTDIESFSELNISQQQISSALKLAHLFPESALSDPIYVQALDLGKGQLAYELISVLITIDDVDLNSVDAIGQNLLHLVLRSHGIANERKAQLITMLVQHGVNLYKQDTLGVSPLLLLLNRDNDGLQCCRQQVLTTLTSSAPESFKQFRVNDDLLLNYMTLHASEFSPQAVALVYKYCNDDGLDGNSNVALIQALSTTCTPRELESYKLAIQQILSDSEPTSQDLTPNLTSYQTIDSEFSFSPPVTGYQPFVKPQIQTVQSDKFADRTLTKKNARFYGHKFIERVKGAPKKLKQKAQEIRSRFDSNFHRKDDTLSLVKFRAPSPQQRVVAVDTENRRHGFVPILFESTQHTQRLKHEIAQSELDNLSEANKLPTKKIEKKRQQLQQSSETVMPSVCSGHVCNQRKIATSKYKLARKHSLKAQQQNRLVSAAETLPQRRKTQRVSVTSQLSNGLPKACLSSSEKRMSIHRLPIASPVKNVSSNTLYDDDVFESGRVQLSTRRNSVKPSKLTSINEQNSLQQDDVVKPVTFTVAASNSVISVGSAKPCAVIPLPTSISDQEQSVQEETEQNYLLQIQATKQAIENAEAANKTKTTETVVAATNPELVVAAENIRRCSCISTIPNAEKGASSNTDMIEQISALRKIASQFDDDVFLAFEESASGLFSTALDAIETGADTLSTLAENKEMDAMVKMLPKSITTVKHFKDSIVTVKDGVVQLLTLFKTMQESKVFEEDAPAEVKRADVALDYLSHGAQFTHELAVIAQNLTAAASELLTLVGRSSAAASQAVPGIGIVVAILDIAHRAVSLTGVVRSYAQMSEYKTILKESFRDFEDLANIIDFDTNQTNKAELKRLAFYSEQDDDIDTSTIDEARRYYLVRGLKKIAEKRIKREALGITVDVANLSASIAELSGVGALAGLGIAISATGIEIGGFTVRHMKQHYHDYMKDEKSNHSKHEAKLRQIEVLIGLLKTIELPDENNEVSMQMAMSQLEEVKQLFKAAGLPLKDFSKPGLTAKDRMQHLYDALQKRE